MKYPIFKKLEKGWIKYIQVKQKEELKRKSQCIQSRLMLEVLNRSKVLR